RLERFVPVHQIRKDRKRLRVESVQSRVEDVRHAPFVDKGRHLGLAYRQLAAVLYLHVLHGIAIGKDAVGRLGPLDYVDELFLQEVTKAHFFKWPLEKYNACAAAFVPSAAACIRPGRLCPKTASLIGACDLDC